MTTAKSGVDATQGKRVRTATVTYPYHPLELCLQLAEAVKRIGNGRSDVSKSMLASSIQTSEQSADFAQKIASSKTFGLLQGKSSLQLSEACREFFFPTEDSQLATKKGLLKFLGAPGAYRAIIDRYDGTKPPTVEILGNILNKDFGIPESWRGRVATQFIRSAQFAGAMGSDGFLRYKATIESLGLPASGTPKEGHHGVEPKSDVTAGKGSAAARRTDEQKTGVIVWTYPCNDGFVRVETPEKMPKETWEKLNKYIQVLEP